MSVSRAPRVIGAVFIIFLAAGSALVYRQAEIGTAALVNGERIWMEPINNQIDTFRAKDPKRFKGAAGRVEEERLRKLFLEERIRYKLIAQEAIKTGVRIAEADLDKVLAERKKLFSSDSSEGAFTNAIAGFGLTEDTFRSRVHDELIQLKMRIKLAKAVTVAESEIQSYIRHNSAEFEGPVEQVKLSVVTTDVQATAHKFLEGLKEGRDFKDSARELSLPVQTAWYPTAWLDLPLAEVIALTDLGKHTNSTPNPDNSISIYRLEERTTRRSEEAEVADQIRAKVLREKQEQSFRNWLDSIARSADIRTNI